MSPIFTQSTALLLLYTMVLPLIESVKKVRFSPPPKELPNLIFVE
jgi:hypothetical protein